MTTIYRVQDLEGRGPWKPGLSSIWMEDHDYEWSQIHSAWWQEFGFGFLKQTTKGMAFGSGTRTLEGLRFWFSEGEYAKLKSMGYQAVKMGVERILAESPIQCVFERVKPLKEGVEPVELYEQTKEKIRKSPTDSGEDQGQTQRGEEPPHQLGSAGT